MSCWYPQGQYAAEFNLKLALTVPLHFYGSKTLSSSLDPGVARFCSDVACTSDVILGHRTCRVEPPTAAVTLHERKSERSKHHSGGGGSTITMTKVGPQRSSQLFVTPSL